MTSNSLMCEAKINEANFGDRSWQNLVPNVSRPTVATRLASFLASRPKW
jgi:hypothetical protein